MDSCRTSMHGWLLCLYWCIVAVPLPAWLDSVVDWWVAAVPLPAWLVTVVDWWVAAVPLPAWLVTVVDWWIVAVPHLAWFVCFYLVCLKCECLIEVWWKYSRKVIIFLLGVDCDYGKSVLHLLFLLLSPDVRRLKVRLFDLLLMSEMLDLIDLDWNKHL